ncbi:MAG: extracellular solute-binding protein [Thermomicrobiales bacterium]|nr:extracellular solute-binding protein [Thermomicrobiales bacterium]
MATVRLMQEEYFPRQAASLPAFTEETGIEVTIDLLPVDPFWHDARTAFGPSPTWDLLAPDEVIVAEQLRRGLLEPLGRLAHRDGLNLDDFPQAGIDRFRAADMVYAIPYVAMSNVLIYRADILERYEMTVPTTWDELRETALAARSALRADGVDDVVGFTSRGLAGYGHNFWIVGSTVLPSWGWAWNRGAGQPPLVHSRETVDALAFYAALLREAGPANAAAMTFTDTHRLFGEGKAVFLIDTATELATMRREGPESPGHRSKIAMAPIGPSGRPEPGLYSPAFCIPASSPVKAEAWALLRFLLSYDELLKDTIEGGYAEPARESVFQSAAYAEAYDAEFREIVGQTRRYARINRPLIPNGFELGDIVGAAAEAAIGGQQTADEALRLAQAMIDTMDWSADVD